MNLFSVAKYKKTTDANFENINISLVEICSFQVKVIIIRKYADEAASPVL